MRNLNRLVSDFVDTYKIAPVKQLKFLWAVSEVEYVEFEKLTPFQMLDAIELCDGWGHDAALIITTYLYKVCERHPMKYEQIEMFVQAVRHYTAKPEWDFLKLDYHLEDEN